MGVTIVQETEPVKGMDSENSHLGSRLREERIRLGFNQLDFAGIAEASKHSQLDWEKNRAAPNARALSAWAVVGADVLYILTGRRERGRGDLWALAEAAPSVREATGAYMNSATAEPALSSPLDRELLVACIESLSDRESWSRLTPEQSASAIVALYDLCLTQKQSPSDLLSAPV